MPATPGKPVEPAGDGGLYDLIVAVAVGVSRPVWLRSGRPIAAICRSRLVVLVVQSRSHDDQLPWKSPT